MRRRVEATKRSNPDMGNSPARCREGLSVPAVPEFTTDAGPL
jgi:hypothetical protein